jgi:hypothetical protein
MNFRSEAVMLRLLSLPGALRPGRRCEHVVVALGICLPVPLFAATGLSLPLPPTVERLAAAIVPWADADPAANIEPLTQGVIVRARGEPAASSTGAHDDAQPAVLARIRVRATAAAGHHAAATHTDGKKGGSSAEGSSSDGSGGGSGAAADGGSSTSATSSGGSSGGGPSSGGSASGSDPSGGGSSGGSSGGGTTDPTQPVQTVVDTAGQATQPVVDGVGGTVTGAADGVKSTVDGLVPSGG